MYLPANTHSTAQVMTKPSDQSVTSLRRFSEYIARGWSTYTGTCDTYRGLLGSSMLADAIPTPPLLPPRMPSAVGRTTLRHGAVTTAGPEHPLVRAVGGEPSSEASIEVLNFLSPDGGGPRSAGEGEAGGERAAPGGGGFSRGYGDDFDESRSAVVFRKWFSLEQQQVCIFCMLPSVGPRRAV